MITLPAAVADRSGPEGQRDRATSSSLSWLKSSYHSLRPKNLFGRLDAHDIVGDHTQRVDGVGRTHRHRQDDPGSPSTAHDLDRSTTP